METRKNRERHIERKIESKVKKGFKVFFFILLGIAIAFLVGYIMMHLWNWLMPDLFGLPQIGYWKALGILLLAKSIFGFGGGGGPNKSKKSKKGRRFGATCDESRDFSQWKYYDEFWKEEGEQAYINYVEKINSAKN
ncbi:hypothetical protein [Maribacter sp. 4G9]|uniref:hypothetical protein n=1 Tax=Maribacter sp. 4G9 TaxID=1889777 RepID=UPI000C156374|nr:hypothetical protein [Maribacter sp. 4G9]PIB28559.1 hypothetical protein BFP75_04765 [Maribacter sp. 4G9]